MTTQAQANLTPTAAPPWWPSKYGAGDEAGALNEITPSKVLEAGYSYLAPPDAAPAMAGTAGR